MSEGEIGQFNVQVQKPWAKKLAKVLKAKKDYHNACRLEKTAVNQENNAKNSSELSLEQVRELSVIDRSQCHLSEDLFSPFLTTPAAVDVRIWSLVSHDSCTYFYIFLDFFVISKLPQIKSDCYIMQLDWKSEIYAFLIELICKLCILFL